MIMQKRKLSNYHGLFRGSSGKRKRDPKLQHKSIPYIMVKCHCTHFNQKRKTKEFHKTQTLGWSNSKTTIQHLKD